MGELRSTVRDEIFQTPTKKNSKSSMKTKQGQPEANYFIPDKLVQPVFFAVPKSKRQLPRGIGVLLTLSVAAGAGTVLYTRMVGQESRFIQPTDLTRQPEPQIATDAGPEVPSRGSENFPQLTEVPKNDVAPVPDTTVADESRSQKPMSAKLKVGLLLPHFGAHTSVEKCLEGARRAEEYGFDSVWVRDHLVFKPHAGEGGDNSTSKVCCCSPPWRRRRKK